MSSDEPIDIHLSSPATAESGASDPRRKPAPSSSAVPQTKFIYSPSDDGTDENLLILLHGLGDSHLPFAQLGKSLKLPQTATLSLRAPLAIPLLDDNYQWYPSFDTLGDFLPLSRTNPTPAFELLSNLLDHLTTQCSWTPEKIHLFGFGQGGSIAVETALRYWKEKKARLGSAVSISGPLLSHPTGANNPCPAPVLYFHRPQPFPPPSSDVNALKKVFSSIQVLDFVPVGKVVEGENDGQAMPRNREEWIGIMRFWSERLSKRMFGGGEEGIYEIMTGQAKS